MTVLERILAGGVIAVVRLDDLGAAPKIAEALAKGGVPAVEFTFTNRRAGEAITAAKEALGERGLIGAGSVLDAETARIAILAGAEYIVTPTYKASTIETCHRYGIPVVCGAFTPTEILTAWEAGAELIKVHPASMGGSKYFKDILAPMPQVKLVPSGGVSFDNAGEFIAAGASAVALGSNLVDTQAVRMENWPAVEERARTLKQIVELAREKRDAGH